MSWTLVTDDDDTVVDLLRILALLLFDDTIWFNKDEDVVDEVATVLFKADIMRLLEAVSRREDMERRLDDVRTLVDPEIDITTTTDEDEDVAVTVT
jgi:hypothetical protein